MGMMEDALSVCDDIAAKFPDSDASVEAFYIKADILNGRKRYKEARDVCLMAIGKFASSIDTGKLQYELARAYLGKVTAKRRWPFSKRRWENLKDDNLISAALCKAGDIYLAAGDFDKAMKRYDTVLKYYADGPRADYAQFSIGKIFLFENKFDRAILSFQSALTNFPASSLKREMTFKLALAYFGREDFIRARNISGNLMV